jgi:hypothetical protein
MQIALLKRHSSIFILFLGVVFRLGIFYFNPPNNSFDDHIEAIYLTSKNFNLPHPFQCWECYQPPIYYIFSAAIYKLNSFFLSTPITWKSIQFINTFLSIATLILYYNILLKFKLSKIQTNLYLSFWSVLPIDIFTSSMIGNDYILIFFSLLSFKYFLNIISEIKNGIKISIKNYILLSIFVVLGSLSKQQGLILLFFPSIIFLYFKNKKNISFNFFLYLYNLLNIFIFK